MTDLLSPELLKVQVFYTRIEPQYLVYKFHYGWDYPEASARRTEAVFLAPVGRPLVKDELLRKGYGHLYYDAEPRTPDVLDLKLDIISIDSVLVHRDSTGTLEKVAAGLGSTLRSQDITTIALIANLEVDLHPMTLALICSLSHSTGDITEVEALLRENGIEHKVINFFWRDGVVFL